MSWLAGTGNSTTGRQKAAISAVAVGSLRFPEDCPRAAMIDRSMHYARGRQIHAAALAGRREPKQRCHLRILLRPRCPSLLVAAGRRKPILCGRARRGCRFRGALRRNSNKIPYGPQTAMVRWRWESSQSSSRPRHAMPLAGCTARITTRLGSGVACRVEPVEPRRHALANSLVSHGSRDGIVHRICISLDPGNSANPTSCFPASLLPCCRPNCTPMQ